MSCRNPPQDAPTQGTDWIKQETRQPRMLSSPSRKRPCCSKCGHLMAGHKRVGGKLDCGDREASLTPTDSTAESHYPSPAASPEPSPPRQLRARDITDSLELTEIPLNGHRPNPFYNSPLRPRPAEPATPPRCGSPAVTVTESLSSQGSGFFPKSDDGLELGATASDFGGTQRDDDEMSVSTERGSHTSSNSDKSLRALLGDPVEPLTTIHYARAANLPRIKDKADRMGVRVRLLNKEGVGRRILNRVAGLHRSASRQWLVVGQPTVVDGIMGAQVEDIPLQQAAVAPYGQQLPYLVVLSTALLSAFIAVGLSRLFL